MIALIKTNVIAIVFSLVLHLAIVVLMSVSWSASESKTTVQRPNYVKAKLVELKPKAKKATQTRPTPNKVDLIKNQQMLQEQAKKAEQQRKAELQKKEAEEKRKKEEAQQRQIVEEKARKAKEAEEQRMLTRKQFEQALKEEEGQLLQDSYAIEASSWQDMIAERIERNWSRPPSARNGMRCQISINLVPNGHVVNANIIKGSGDSAFDRSALAAIEKAQPLPIKDMPPEVFERYFRNFTFDFNPQDRRL